MKSFYKLEDIYYNYLTNYEGLYLDKYIKQLLLTSNSLRSDNFYYGLINDRVQFICNKIANNEQNLYTAVFYYSPKYEKYLTIFLKQFDYNKLYGNNYPSGQPFINGIYIYGRQLMEGVYNITNSPSGFNPEWLDLYYDTIYTLNEFKYYNTTDYNDSIYYEKFGNAILPLLSLPIEREFDETYTDIDSYNLYNNDTHILKTDKYNIDIPESLVDDVNISDKIYYSFDKLIYNYNIPNSLSTHHLYLGIENIYNYYNNNDINNVKYDIITINNEYSIIAGELEKYEGLNNDVYYMLYNYSLEPEEINNDSTNQINSTLHGKSIVFDEYVLENYRIVLGDSVYYGLEFVFKLINKNINKEETGIPNDTEVLNVGEYLELIDVATKLNALNLKNQIENSENSINDLYIDVTTANVADISCFRLLNKNVFFRTDVNNNFIIKLSEIDDELILNDTVILSYPYYTKSTEEVYTYSKLDYTNTENYHYGEILSKKLLDSTISETSYTDLISQEEINNVPGYDNLNDFEYKLNVNDKINNILISNNFIESDRFKIYGTAIDIDNSDSNYLNVSSYNDFIKNVNSGKIKILPFPVPILLNSNNMNICTYNAINDINNFIGLDYINDIITNDSTEYNITNHKDIIYDYINGDNALTEYDKVIYNTYNQNALKLNFLDFTLMNKNRMEYIYMIYDTYTESYDIINVFDMNDIDYHVNKLKLENNNKYIRNYVRFYDTNPVDKITYINGTTNLVSGYDITHKPIHYKDIEIKNATNIYGDIIKLVLDCQVYNVDTYTIYNVEYEILLNDFTTVGNDIIYNIENLINSNERIVDQLKWKLYVNMEYKTFTYFNNLIVKFYSNFNNFISTSTSILMGIYYGDIVNEVITDVNVGIYNTELNNILPQTIYSKNISLSLFDIDDDILNYVPDNKKCIFLNNYVGNTDNEFYELIDSTIYDINDISVIDKNSTVYNKFDNQNSVLPYIVNDNIDKYIRIYAKFSINELSDLIEEFEYNNLYNIDFYEESKGVLVLDGKITDITDHTTIDDILKEYKINMNFTISNNVNNNITIPIDVDLTYELYNNYSNYTNNLPDFNSLKESSILMDVRNRGDYIESETTYSPKLLDYIEYYDIYPEFSLQEEVLHDIELEIKLTTSDTTAVKVSELYFDIFNCTDDLLVAIPEDYENLENPEEEINNVILSNSKYEILDYFNYLIRYKCNNCSTTTLSLTIKNKPKYFGFNIASILLGCYSHNIKLELFVPYMFYKESADTVFIIDKKSSIEKTKEELSPLAKSTFLDAQGNHTANYYDSFSNNYDKENLVNYIDKPTKSKSTLLLFNSSFNNKKIAFSLRENNTPKTIINDYKEYNIAPLEFKILSLSEDIDATDYSDSYDSGIAIYDLIEHDLETDVTTIIDEVELPIPSLDDYLRAVLNFIDKTAKLVQIDFEQNQFYIDESAQNNKYKIEKTYSSSKISFINSSVLQVENNNSLVDIDYLFYVNETYKIVIDRSNLTDIINLTSQFGDVIYVKIPIIYPQSPKYIVDDIDNFNIPSSDETAIIDFNNMFDGNQNYLYLIGKQTNVDQFSFTLNGIISVKNETLLSYILNNNFNIDDFKTFGISLNFKIVDPAMILSLFFKDYGDNLSISIANYLVGKDKIISNNNIEILSNLVDELAVENSPKSRSLTKNLSVIGKSHRYILPEITYEKVSKLTDTGFMEIYNNDLNGTYNKSYVFPSIMENPGDYGRYTESVKFYLNTFNENANIPIEDTVNLDNLLFDDVNETLSNSNFLTDNFNSSGYFKTNIKLTLNNGLKVSHYISLSCDGHYDNIISASINSSLIDTNGYEFYFKGDDNIKFSTDDNYLSVIFENLKLNTLQLVIDNTKYNLSNSPYKLLSAMQRKILDNPLIVKTIDYNENPITIISDSNYKMIFEMPVQIFKATQSYLVIDKIRIADNFINDTDYCIMFGDTNEIYNVKSNNEKILNKTYYKYDKNNLRFLVRGFNIPNQTGEYYTTLIIYYTFNGENYTITKDIRYKVELSEVLDNEYLIAEVNRLDYVKNPSYSKEDNFGNITEQEIGDSVADKTVSILTDVYKGTAGCDLSYPDLKWFKNG